ncbi:AAA domain-containing protein [Nocardia tengchongensis]|uniref:AAA domain-containing protein n=1 Tax=Nocardia tengchongensis TaxID=2055889 RepID=UPI003691C880
MAASQDAVRLIEYFLCGSTAQFGPYQTIDDEPVTVLELFPDKLYRARMIDSTDRTVDVQIFLGIEELGGLLWEQGVRALLRVVGADHPALPEVLAGGYRTSAQTGEIGIGGGMAFVATRGGLRQLCPKDTKHFRSQPTTAFREFRSLAQGLAELHYLGLFHRNLTPASVDVFDGPRMQLARFELSSLIEDLFRSTVDSVTDAAELRELLARNVGSPTYLPPERADFLHLGDTDLIENERADIYGLASIAWEWFLGPFPAEWTAQLPDPVPGSVPATEARTAHRAFTAQLRQAVSSSSLVPQELAHVLWLMLAPDPKERPSADQVLGLLTAGYDRIMAGFAGPATATKYVMVFMPRESIDTIHKWSLVQHDPTTQEGERELAAFIASDMRGAYMSYSPAGAEPFIHGRDDDSRQSARQVIRGQQLVWFCEYYRPRDEWGSLGAPTEQALLIKYVAPLSNPMVTKKLEALPWGTARRVPELSLHAITVDREVMQRRIAGARSWRDIVDATTPRQPDSAADIEFREATEWLMDYQQVVLSARTYPYEVVETDGSGVLIRYDAQRDQRRIVESALFIKYAETPALRPEFGTFFGALEENDGEREVDILGDRNGRPAWSLTCTTQIVRREGRDRILLRHKNGEPAIPRQGWLRPTTDRGAQWALEGQREASTELYRAKNLRGYLRDPRTIRTFAHHWIDAGSDLAGDGPEVVREMLVCEPFCAIQGPPGTGKTRVAAAAIGAYLRRHPAARILVSAQSNFALDNLAVRILKELGEMDENDQPVRRDDEELRPVALRITTRGTEAQGRVDKTMWPWRRLDGATLTQDQIRARVGRRLRDDGEGTAVLPGRGELRGVLEQWSHLLSGREESIIPELADRLHRGANLIFATCAASKPELLSPNGTAFFDWVLVEEAAKAWPSELAIPLMRGRRWTLIGDHFQLPAHRRADLERFLNSCAADPHPMMAAITADKVAAYLRTFDLFGHLFQRPADPQLPLRRMSVQFRSREPLGALVSRVFYPAAEQPEPCPADGLPVGGLTTFVNPQSALRIPPIHVSTPPELDGESLVWLDTSGITSCRSEPHWHNRGEAALVVRLMESLAPFPHANRHGYGPSPLAVITPYREQLRLLKGNSLVSPFLSTIHAFQGREADMVIVSLVRDRIPGDADSAHAIQAGLGHLAQQQLANVLFSRARRQLVIIGRFDHYAKIMGPEGFWTRACRAVQLYGTVLSARELFGDLPGLSSTRQITPDNEQA